MFELYNGKIRLVEDNISYPIFKEWMSKLSAEKARKRVLFVFLYASRSNDNPIKDYEEKARRAEALRLVYGSKPPAEEEMKELIYAAKQYYRDEHDKLQKEIDLYDKKIFQFIELLDKTEPEIVRNEHEITGKVTFATNIDIINGVLENSLSVILDKASLQSLQKSGHYNKDLRPSLDNKKRDKLFNYDT